MKGLLNQPYAASWLVVEVLPENASWRSDPASALYCIGVVRLIALASFGGPSQGSGRRGLIPSGRSRGEVSSSDTRSPPQSGARGHGGSQVLAHPRFIDRPTPDSSVASPSGVEGGPGLNADTLEY